MKTRTQNDNQMIKNWQVFPSTLEENQDQIRRWIAREWATCFIKLQSNSITLWTLKQKNTNIDPTEVK